MRLKKMIPAWLLVVPFLAAPACQGGEKSDESGEALKAVATFKSYRTERGLSAAVTLGAIATATR